MYSKLSALFLRKISPNRIEFLGLKNLTILVTLTLMDI
jgi:hypothetical protein